MGLGPLYFSVFSDQSTRSVTDNDYNIAIAYIFRIDNSWININIIRIHHLTIFNIRRSQYECSR